VKAEFSAHIPFLTRMLLCHCKRCKRKANVCEIIVSVSLTIHGSMHGLLALFFQGQSIKGKK